MRRLAAVIIGMCLVSILVMVGGAAAPARAAALPAGFSEQVVASGLSRPTAFAMAPDGRIFVTLQDGAVRVIQNGTLLSTPFLTLSGISTSGERGLLGIAFDPNFSSNQYIYLYYTSTSPSTHNRVIRVTANGNVELAGSRIAILELNNLSTATNHNGGALHFGPDGKLYVAVGENANGSNAQTLGNLLGKMLRINPDGSIPADNPFVGTTGARGEIWARGLRNPYTFSFQPGTGRMFINDVGAQTWEEINEGLAGANYGWPTTEGNFNQTTYPTYTLPLYAYPHGTANGQGCAITGGTFYNPAAPMFPAEYEGKYFFADYCGDWIWTYDPASDSASSFVTGTIPSPVDLMTGPDGGLYYLSRGDGGAVVRIVYTESGQPPTIVQHPQSQTVTAGYPATFTCSASSSVSFTYLWRRDGTDIPGATSNSYTLPAAALSDNGAVFQCAAINTYGETVSSPAVLTVVSNQPPVVTLTKPTLPALYSGGQTIAFEATATDPETGTLPASAFTWVVNFHHADHTHPQLAPTSGIKSGSFTVPRRGETATNVFYQIRLTVTDPDGLSTTVTRDVLPRVVNLNFITATPGFTITVDGQPHLTPYTVGSVVGMYRDIGAPSPQMFNGTIYGSTGWTHTSAINHTITTPSSNTTYTATFARRDLQNPSFDIDSNGDNRPDSWTYTPTSPRLWLDCGTGVDGCSVKLQEPDGDTRRLYQRFSVRGNAGDKFTLRVWSRGQNLTAGKHTIRLAIWYTDGTSQYVNFNLPAGSHDWTQRLLSVTSARNYEAVTVMFWVRQGQSRYVWYDAADLSFEDGTSPSPTPTPTPTPNPMPDPTALGPGYYEDSDPNITYTGAWAFYAKIGASSGGYMRTADPNGRATFRFTGTKLTIYRTLASNRGPMDVCIDGSCQRIQNYNATTVVTQPVVFNVAEGTHTVEIRNTSSAYIDLDALRVESGTSLPPTPTPTPTPDPTALGPGYYEDSDPNITYTGVWAFYAKIGASGGGYMRTADPNGRAKFSFTGTKLTIYRTLAINRGAMDVCIDGVCQRVNNYSSTTIVTQPVVYNVSAGTHVVEIRNTSSAYIDLDALRVE